MSNAPIMQTSNGDGSANLYFGYGSNLNLVHLKEMCRKNDVDPAGIEPIGPASLPDMHLTFNYRSARWHGGVLNVTPVIGARVTGYLFRLSDEVWQLFDRKEGHPDFYRRTSVGVLTGDGKLQLATTYIVAPHRAGHFVTPSPAYLEICRKGREAMGLEIGGLLAAARGEQHLLDALFCYGTLMRGEQRSAAVRRHGVNCALLAEARGVLYDHGDFPGMALHGDGDVPGDFFRSADISRLLVDLDRIEGFYGFGNTANLFDRVIIDVHVGDGRVRCAWAYVVRSPSGVLLEVQDWRATGGRSDLFRQRVVAIHLAAAPDLLNRLTEDAYRFSGYPADQWKTLSMPELMAGLANGQMSERELAQVSGVWTAGVDDWL